MSNKIVLLIILHAMLLGRLGYAQHKIELGGYVGQCGYLGDLNKSDWFSKEPRLGYGFLARYNATPFFALRASLLHGRLTGRDSNYADREFRNFSSESPLTEASLQMEWHFWGMATPKIAQRFRTQFSPFLFVGIGTMTFNPTPDLDHIIIAKPEYIDGSEIDSGAKFNKITGIAPFGLGIKLRVSLEWTITAEAGFRLAFSDYLDGISHAGNPNKNDRYKFSGITVAYRLPQIPTRCSHKFD